MTDMRNKPKQLRVRVLVLGGGPDSEREVSIESANAIHQGCLDAGLDSTLLIIDRPTIDEVRAWDADVVFPALHGRFGEGGALQSMLEAEKKVFVGCRAKTARFAMDKLATKLIASRCGVLTPAACVFDPKDAQSPEHAICPFDLPVVIKPIADGSSVGLHICKTRQSWTDAVKAVGKDLSSNPDRVYMIERMVKGRELTVSVLGQSDGSLQALPIVEIAPADGVYDFNAKYARDDTVYTVNPDLADDMVSAIQNDALRVCIALGVDHLGRVDFLLGDDDLWAMLEVNTMPGFTATSLLPKAAADTDMPMHELCAHLVRCAIGSKETTKSPASTPAH